MKAGSATIGALARLIPRVPALVASLLIAGGAFAQTGWQAEWKKTVEAAHKEGSVVLWVAPNPAFREAVTREWQKDYPGINLSLTAMPGGPFFTRIRTERGAGKFLWDVTVTGNSNNFPLIREGFIDSLLPELVDPDVINPKVWGGWEEAFYDRDRKYVLGMQIILRQIFYNAQLLPPDTVKAKGINVLFDPALRGKIVWLDPNLPGAGVSMGYVLRKTLGDEGLKKLIFDQKVLFVRTTSEVGERLARGVMTVGIGPTITSMMAPYIKAGLKLDIRPLGVTPETGTFATNGGTGIMVVNKRPHPNASRVFVNWILSKRVQTVLSKDMGENSRRSDVPDMVPPDRSPLAGAKYLDPQREENIGDEEAATQWLKELRGL